MNNHFCRQIAIILSLFCRLSLLHAEGDKPIRYESTNAKYLNQWIRKPNYKAPSFIGMDNDSLSSYIAHSFQYPYDLIGDSISSRCMVSFKVDSMGCVSSIMAVKPSENIPVFAEEAERVIKALKFSGCPLRYDSLACKWQPDTLGLTISFEIVPYPIETIDDKETVIEELARINSYQYFGDNGWGGMPNGWVLQQKLKAMTSIEEKVNLFQAHDNPVIRFTAFNGLLENKYSGCASLVKNSISDDTIIIGWSFDCGVHETFADAVISKLFHEKGAFSVADSLAIDSVIFYSSNVGCQNYRYRLLQRLQPTPERYARAKELCMNKQESAALPLLAKYQRKEDKALFIEALGEYAMGLNSEDVYDGSYRGRADDALKAVISWPDKDFIPVLKKLGDFEVKRKHHNYQRIQNFYTVIMEYDNKWAYKYLEEYLEKKEAWKVFSHPEHLYSAYYLNKHPHERFLPLVKKYGKQPFEWKYIKEYHTGL